ncbi:MAG TPA: hypothetical protein VFV65_02170 [Gemmatimonadales bacterium]|nr:hypothetical protein [Gemmatimonadales bacterium]
MYRIRLSSGQEQTYRSIQELTAGVQRGEVTGDAEIYHQRSERWLPIESHPHYKMASEGGTATRTSSRLKFTRPSSPAVPATVLPTPAPQAPDKNDLEELNRLLVLLDPLPTPAQQTEPKPPAVTSPPDLTLVRPDPVEPSSEAEGSEQRFGTMLRLEDLAPVPSPAPAAPEPVEPLEVIRDERERVDEEADAPAGHPEPEPVAEVVEEIAPTDLGLPVEIVLEEIPIPESEPEELVVESIVDEVPVVAAIDTVVGGDEPAVAPFAPPPMSVERFGDPEPLTAAAPAGQPARRFRPMLYVGAAAVLAAGVFALTGSNSDTDQNLVSPAAAMAPPTAAVAPGTNDSAPVPAAPAAAGFPLPSAGQPKPAPAATVEPAPDTAPSAILPSAPTLDLRAGGTARVDAGTAAAGGFAGAGAALARSYATAYDELAADFAAQMDRSGLVRLFSQTQITTTDGIAGARRALDAATAAVKQYHSKESAVERTFQDSARALERRGASSSEMRDWITHISRKESQEAAGEGTRLLGQIDAVFALLQAQSGRYRVAGSEIRFDNADAGARYAELQGWITRRLEHWAGQPASSVPLTVQPILEGVGLTRLPVSR